MPTLRFTGARTGLVDIWLPQYGGCVKRNDEIEVPDEIALVWLEEPSDFVLVDGQTVEDFWKLPETVTTSASASVTHPKRRRSKEVKA